MGYNTSPPPDRNVIPGGTIERSGTLSLPTAASLNNSGQVGDINLIFQAMRSTLIDVVDIIVENLMSGSLEFDLYKIPDGVDLDTALAQGTSYAGYIARLQFPVSDVPVTGGALGIAAVRRTFDLSATSREIRKLEEGDRLLIVSSSKVDVYTFSYSPYGGTMFGRASWAFLAHTGV
jgi:hypothetical protein